MQMEMNFKEMVDLGADPVPTNGGYETLSPFVVLFTGTELPCEVDLIGEIRDGVAVCTSLRLREVPGRPITADTLRDISVPRLLALASNWATPAQTPEELAAGKRTPEQKEKVIEALRSRKHRITTSLLAEVAEIYKKAGDDWPTKAVAEQKSVSRSTAATWVGLARKEGLIPPVKKTTKKGARS
jgi:hypothetical protein